MSAQSESLRAGHAWMQVEHLRDGCFLTDGINVIAVGRSGAGKSHLACALGHALIEQGHPVLFASTSKLFFKDPMTTLDTRIGR